MVIIGALAAIGAFSGSKSSKSSTPSVTIVPSGTVWNLDAGYYEYAGPFDLTNESSWTVSGSFTASEGIDAYIMTSDEYAAWGGSGSPTAYTWTSGTGVTSGNFNAVIPGNTYYFVWDNTNIVTESTVEITVPVVATA